MKILFTTAAAAAALLAAAPALADPPAVSGYGTLGYTDFNGDSANLGAITGRLGARWGRYVGVEGELSGGVTSDTANVPSRANMNPRASPRAPWLDGLSMS